MGYPAKEEQQAVGPAAAKHERQASAASSAAPATPSPAHVDRMLAVQSQFDLGDQETGTSTKSALMMFSRPPGRDNAVTTSLTGDPSIQLLSAPHRLPMGGESGGPDSAVRFVFKPAHKGHVEANLHVEASWGAGGEPIPHESHDVKIIGAAHVRGQPELAEEEANERARAKSAEDAAHAAHEQEVVKENVGAFLETDFPVHEGHKQQLVNEQKRVEIAMANVFDHRRTAIETAQQLIGEYDQFTASAPKSLVETLAMAALQAVGITLATEFSVLARPILEAALSTTTIHRVEVGPTYVKTTTPTALVDFVTGVLKETTKQLVKAGVSGIGKGSGDHAAESSVSSIMFFAAQKDGLADEKATRATTVSIGLLNQLLMNLEADPAGSIAAMRAIGDNLEKTATTATEAQLQSTISHWVRFLAQGDNSVSATQGAARGHKTIEGESTIDPERPNGRFASPEQAKPLAGMVEVRFTGSLRSPADPIVVTSARLNGVSNSAIEKIHKQPIADLGLPLRAVGTIESESLTITIVRDEAGNVAYTDNTNVEWQQSRWLARHVGEPGATVTAEMKGAKAIAEELAAKPLATVNHEGLVSDSVR